MSESVPVSGMAKRGEFQSRPCPTWQVPNITDCRALRFGSDDDMAYCLREDAHRCSYALRIGSGYFCHHPRRREIVARTKADGLWLR